MIPHAVRQKYDSESDQINDIRAVVGETIRNFCTDNGFPYVERIKELSSVAEKLETGRFSTWSSIDDLFGCIIVIPTLSHEEHVIEFLSKAFQTVQTRLRGETKKPPDQFRFEATRFYGRLKHPSKDQRDSGVIFEVQIRSAFEHAWSAATHHIYKSDKIDWKAKRLVAQLKAAVEQLDSLVLAFDESKDPIVEHRWPEVQAQSDLLNGFQQLFDEDLLPAELRPVSWSRFAENALALLRSSQGFERWNTSKMLFAVKESLLCARQRAIQEGKSGIPISVSLLQWAMAAWVDADQLKPPLHRFHALVTPEFVELYPSVKTVSPTIDLQY